MSLVLPTPTAHAPTSGARLVAHDGRDLPFRGGSLTVDAASGLARVVLRQRFANPHAEPLRVSWQVPLPADAAVSGFAFALGDTRVEGEVDRTRAARERFEEALVDGRTAALLEQDRSSLFTQEVGNIPAGGEVVCELALDQRLVWVGGGWEWRFPTVVAPRFLGADVVVDVYEAGNPAKLALAMGIRDPLTGPVTGLPAEGGAPMDRDLAVRWPVAAPKPGLAVDVARSATGFACALVAIVPPTGPAPAVPRDLILLLDTSGSMSGRPLAQAQAVCRALVDTLRDADQLEILEFSNHTRSWRPGPVAATAANRADANRWVSALRAGGGTEMRTGILAALAAVRADSMRQVVLVTDGLIGFEREIVGAVRDRLPRGSRAHTVGIGSATNRSLLSPVARAGAGIEVILGVDDDPAEGARRLVAATACPLVVDVEISGSAVVAVAHHRVPDLLAGRPASIAVQLRPEGGTIEVRGRTAAGPWSARHAVAPLAPGAGSRSVVACFGREQVEEAELRAAGGEDVDREIEALGLQFQIATRLTSWVAVATARTVDPRDPSRRQRIPQSVPYGTNIQAFGLRSASAAPHAQSAAMPMSMPVGAPPPPAKAKAAGGGPVSRALDALGGVFRGRRDAPAAPAPVRRATGRIVLASGGIWVLEVDVVGEDLPWFPPGEVELHRVGGGSATTRIDTARTTAPAHLPVGTMVRIAFDATGLDPASVAEITLVAEPRSRLVLAVSWAR
jgi:Ca-activated chloride channel family protein